MCASGQGEELRDDLFAGPPDTFFIKYLLAKAVSCKEIGLLVVNTSVASMHAPTDEEICVKVLSGIKSSRFWRLEAAVSGTRKASKHCQEYSSDKIVTTCFSNRTTSIRAFTNGFVTVWTWNSTVTIFWCVD